MTSLLPPLHDGHAPIYLHHAFQQAVDAYEDWTLGPEEPVVPVNGRLARIGVIFRRLWNCTDPTPRHTLDAMKDIVPHSVIPTGQWRDSATIAEAARIMSAALERRRARRLPALG